MGGGLPPHMRVYTPYGGFTPIWGGVSPLMGGFTSHMGAFTPPHIGVYVSSQNVKSMKTIILVMNGFVTRDFGLLRRAIDAESQDLAI